MGVGRITKASETAHGGVRRSVETAKPRLDTSPLSKTTDALIGAMRMKGKLLSAYGGLVETLGATLGGAFREFSNYRMARAKLAADKQEKEAADALKQEADRCRTAEGKPCIDPGDVCANSAHNHGAIEKSNPYADADGKADVEKGRETPFKRRQKEAEDEIRRRKAEEKRRREEEERRREWLKINADRGGTWRA